MGGIRFTLGALQQIMQSKIHEAHVAILPQEQAEPLLQDVSADNGGTVVSCHVMQTTSKASVFSIVDMSLMS